MSESKYKIFPKIRKTLEDRANTLMDWIGVPYSTQEFLTRPLSDVYRKAVTEVT